MLRYRVRTADGRRVENTLPVGFASRFPEGESRMARGGPARLACPHQQRAPAPGRIRFDALAEHYLQERFWGGCGPP